MATEKELRKMFEKYKNDLAKKDANWISLNLVTGEAEITSDELFFQIFKAGYEAGYYEN